MEQPGTTWGWRDDARPAWKFVRVVASFAATVWFVNETRADGGAAAALGAITFAVVWCVLTLLGLAVRHPGTALWVAFLALAAWAIISGLAALPLKALVVIVILLLLFR
jgi:energy-converting hydrogenase Eha subunit B